MTSVSSQAQLTLIDTNDLFLTKDPSLNLFRPTNRTYTPLAQDYVFHRPETEISGLPGEKVHFSLRRTGDLLSNLFLRFRGSPLSKIYPIDGKGSVLGTAESGSSKDDQRARFKWGPLAYHVIDSVSLTLNSTTIDSLYGDYNILYVDPNYQYSLVGTKDRKNLWILARNKKINNNVIMTLIMKGKELGFPIDKLIYQ